VRTQKPKKVMNINMLDHEVRHRRERERDLKPTLKSERTLTLTYRHKMTPTLKE